MAVTLLSRELFGAPATRSAGAAGGFGTIAAGTVTCSIIGLNLTGGGGFHGRLPAGFQSADTTALDVVSAPEIRVRFGLMIDALPASECFIYGIAPDGAQNPDGGGGGFLLKLDTAGKLYLLSNGGSSAKSGALTPGTRYFVLVRLRYDGTRYTGYLYVADSTTLPDAIGPLISYNITASAYSGFNSLAGGAMASWPGGTIEAYSIEKAAVDDPLTWPAYTVPAPPYTISISANATGGGDGTVGAPLTLAEWVATQGSVRTPPANYFKLAANNSPIDPATWSEADLVAAIQSGAIVPNGLDKAVLTGTFAGTVAAPFADQSICFNGMEVTGGGSAVVDGRVTLDPDAWEAIGGLAGVYCQTLSGVAFASAIVDEDGKQMRGVVGTGLATPATENGVTYAEGAGAALAAVAGSMWVSGDTTGEAITVAVHPSTGTPSTHDYTITTPIQLVVCTGGYLHDLTVIGTEQFIQEGSPRPAGTCNVRIYPRDLTVVRNVATDIWGGHAFTYVRGSTVNGDTTLHFADSATAGGVGAGIPIYNVAGIPYISPSTGAPIAIAVYQAGTTIGSNSHFYFANVPADAVMRVPGGGNASSPYYAGVFIAHESGAGTSTPIGRITVTGCDWSGGSFVIQSTWPVLDLQISSAKLGWMGVYADNGTLSNFTAIGMLTGAGSWSADHGLVIASNFVVAQNTLVGASLSHMTFDLTRTNLLNSNDLGFFRGAAAAGAGTLYLTDSLVIRPPTSGGDVEPDSWGIFQNYGGTQSGLFTANNLYVTAQSASAMLATINYDGSDLHFDDWQLLGGDTDSILEAAPVVQSGTYIPFAGSAAVRGASDGTNIGALAGYVYTTVDAGEMLCLAVL